jgi:hypothetical protein
MNDNIAYLNPLLRVKIGDLTPASYRYLDEWLLTALVASVRAFWGSKYSITDLGDVTRNQGYYFTVDESLGVIESKDDYPIVVSAAIIILQGGLQSNSWNLASWKDAEISYSNLEGGRIQDGNLTRLYNELYSFVKPPGKRLAQAFGSPLPGFHKNRFENKKEL